MIVGADGVGLARTVQHAFGLIYVCSPQGGAEIFKAQAIRGQRGGICLNAHRRLLATADGDQPYSRHLRNLLGQRGIGKVFDF